ncbi:HNH endonuclease [Vibrio cholerae]|nr:HNH endonuclease [Vibrio cholerae]
MVMRCQPLRRALCANNGGIANMSEKSKNKHGLSRYIKSSVKEKIRRDAGFGCVFCGCVLVEYEHIEPEYHDAKIHDPDKMTILCPTCHDKVTKKIISKKRVLAAKENPKALQNGYVNDMLLVATESVELLIGNVRTSMFGVAINLYGKPLFWFEPADDPDEPYKICCIFYGAEGKPIAYINRNEYIALVGKQDIVSKGTTLSITDKKYGCLLELSRTGDEPLHIKRLFTQLHSTKIVVDGENSPILFGDINQPNDQLGGIGNLTLAGSGVSSHGTQTALALGGVPTEKLYKPLVTSLLVARYGSPILKFNGELIAWSVGNRVINKKYASVAVIDGNRVMSIANEFIGYLDSNQIGYDNEQYASGEPIYITPNDRSSKCVRLHEKYDLSYRIT